MFKEILNSIIKRGPGEYEIGSCFLELTVSACLKRSEGWVNMKSVHVFWN